MASTTLDRVSARRAYEFVKTTLVGGVVFLVPAFVLVVLLAKAFGLLRKVAEPLGAVLPLDRVVGVLVADIVVVVLLVLACFGAGFLARVSLATRFLKKAEAGVLWRIPGYSFVQGMTATLNKDATASAMHPVLVNFAEFTQLAFEVEQLADGRRVIFVPGAPDPRSGSVFVVPGAIVEAAPTNFVGAIASLRALGRGLGQALKSTSALPSSG